MRIDHLIQDAFTIAKAKGFTNATIGEDFALMHSEISEALEEYRNGRRPDEIYTCNVDGHKPLGIPIELADVVIRIAHFCGKHGIDLERAISLKLSYNDLRPFKHGGKKI
jgi:NTP pyrophosphatase (non-canonical NTP hydrolase)